MDHPSIITIMTLPSQTTFIFIQPIIIILLLVMYISYTTYYISFCTFILLLTNIVHVLLSLGKDYTFGLVRNILSLPTQQNTLQAIKQHDRFIVMCGLQYIYIPIMQNAQCRGADKIYPSFGINDMRNEVHISSLMFEIKLTIFKINRIKQAFCNVQKMTNIDYFYQIIITLIVIYL